MAKLTKICGIKISKVKNLNLFKFNNELQSRLENLSEQKQSGRLTSEEEAELTGILELDRGITPTGRATCNRLDLNNERHNEGSIIKARRL